MSSPSRFNPTCIGGTPAPCSQRRSGHGFPDLQPGNTLTRSGFSGRHSCKERYAFHAKRNVVSALALLFVGSACSSGPKDVVVESQSSALSASDHFYLRCNVTTWELNSKSYMAPTGADGMLRVVDFTVDEEWKLTGNTCQPMSTNVLGQWGSSPVVYTAVQHEITVPGATLLTSGYPQFPVKFPSLGRYRAILNASNGSLSISQAATALIENPLPNETVPHELVVVEGAVPGTQSTVNITSGQVTRTVRVVNGRYKGLVSLALGANKIKVTGEGLAPNEISVSYQPSTNDHLVRLVYVVAKDDDGTFQVGPWTRAGGDDPSKPLGANDAATAIRKIKLAGLMIQTAYAEIALRAGLGRRTFRLDRTASGEVAVQTLVLPQTRDELWNTYYANPADEPANWGDRSPNGERRAAFYYLIANQLPQEPLKFLAFTSMSRYDSTNRWEYTSATLGIGNLGLQSANMLGTFPESVDEIATKFNDGRLASDLGITYGSARLGEKFSTDMGGAAHELGHGFGFDHPEDFPCPCSMMSRGFDWFVRLFVSSGAGESTWPASEEMCLDPTSVTRLDQSPWFR
jgi:hypothetical protein